MTEPDTEKKRQKMASQKPSFQKVLQKSSLSFLAMTPLLLATIGLVGIFQVLVTPKMLTSMFRGNPLLDTLTGTLSGAVAAGNPIVSYIIGGELLNQGVSLYAVSAFLLSWITLGFIQLPAEIEVFGGRFTLYRNILAFIFVMITAALTTLTMQVLS
ncbi:putative permease [Desulfocapsa sulfexigens DSM 10523]|uniref:Putative permease n=1 Tax=Desulfocapsa sulfexigens (strain DSM 10523 / SB164P1) TaxID=1167006 RepID=M1NGC9_DESSD|nr:putative permease [Desulfocapsa sulfexigens]AGF78709.1 putative permease [Desulfocapsa sulfexigens DSM 10523]